MNVFWTIKGRTLKVVFLSMIACLFAAGIIYVEKDTHSVGSILTSIATLCQYNTFSINIWFINSRTNYLLSTSLEIFSNGYSRHYWPT